MNFIYMTVTVLPTMILTTAFLECNLSQSSETRCLGEEGQPLIFHLSKEAKTEIRLAKDGKYRVLKREISGEVKVEEGFDFQHVDKGTFKLTSSWKNHSGDYEMEEFNSDGKLLKKITARVKIHERDLANTSVSGPPGSNPDVGDAAPVQTVVVVVSSASAVALVLLVTLTFAILKLRMTPRHQTAAVRRHSENDVIYTDVRVIPGTRGNKTREP